MSGNLLAKRFFRLKVQVACVAFILVGGFMLSVTHSGASALNFTSHDVTLGPLGAGGGLYGISCLTSTSCVGVGYDGNNQPLVIAGNPNTWTESNAEEISIGNITTDVASLNAVYCSSITSCVAVGYSVNSTTSASNAILLTGDPSSWTETSVVSLAPTSDVRLSGLSCQSTSQCTAVGYGSSSGNLYTWTGDPSTWTSSNVTSLTLGGAFSSGGQLNSVFCAAATSCVAVGEDYNGQPLTLVGNPANWTNTAAHEVTLDASFQNGGDLSGVTCITSSSCVAVGHTGSSDDPLALVGDPSSWTEANANEISLSSSIASGNAGQLLGIQCVSITSCVALGTTYNDEGFSVQGNPSTWTTTDATSLDPTNGSDTTFSALYCASSSNCVAAGYSLYPNGVLTLSGNPASWSPSGEVVLSFDTSLGAFGTLSAVQCFSATSCVGVGQDENGEPFSIVGNPATWVEADATQISLGSGFGSGGNLVSVSCQSVSSCVAVGYDQNGFPLSAQGDPSSWSVSDATEITNAGAFGGGGSFKSVSCTSSSWCLAVGSDNLSFPLLLSGNPSSWSSNVTQIDLSATPEGGASFTSVQCFSSTSCVATGSDSSSYVVSAVGNPAGWTASSVNDYSALTYFASVHSQSCTSVTSCTIVGLDTLTNLPFTVTGNPASLTPSEVNEVALSGSLSGPATLNAVTCTSATNCTAVGEDSSGISFAIVGNPVNWDTSDLVTISDLPTTTNNDLYGVSCVDSSTCVGVGVDGIEHPFATVTSAPASPPTPIVSTAPPVNISVSFNLNQGSGVTPPSLSAIAGSAVLLPSSGFSRTGYKFLGWSDGITTYGSGAVFTIPTKSVTLRAQWQQLTTSVEYHVLFAFNSYQLDTPDKTVLQKLALQIQKRGSTSIKVFGYTDTVGSVAYNEVLSEQRAKATAAYLTRILLLHHVVNVKIQIIPKGESTTFDNPAQDRRVGISW